MPKSNGLTEKQKAFVREYLIDFNATQAATRAGYSKKTARQAGTENLAKPAVAVAIQARVKKVDDRALVSATEVLVELGRLATVDVSDIFDDEGQFRPIKELPEAVRRSISSIEMESVEVTDKDGNGSTVRRVKRLRFWDKKGALDSLGKHHKLFTELREIHGKVTLEALLGGEDGESDGAV